MILKELRVKGSLVKVASQSQCSPKPSSRDGRKKKSDSSGMTRRMEE